MEISELTIRILLLFFPGIICTLIVDSLTVHRERTPFVFAVHSFIFGLSSYLFYYLVKYVLDQIPYISNFVNAKVMLLDALTKRELDVDYTELIWATVISAIPLALFFSRFLNRKYFHHFARFIGVTKKINDLGVWDVTFDLVDIEWVHVRDTKNDLVYQGRVAVFSDFIEDNELLLTNVTVFRNSTGHELYKVGALYLARERHEITIEFPAGFIARQKENTK